MEMMDDLYWENSTVMISQLPVNEWYGIMGTTLADAIHNSHRLELGGESTRKLMAEAEKPTSRREETEGDF